MGKRTFNIEVGAIPSVVEVGRMLAARFKEVNDYKQKNARYHRIGEWK